MSRLEGGERGAVALLTTIIISILLALIVTGLVGLMISELRQSTDSAEATKAYYAAEAGVEEGIGKVIAALGVSPKIDQLCPATPAPGNVTTTKNLNLVGATPGVVGWTCQQITYSGSPTGSLPLPDKAVQIDVGSDNFGSVRVKWELSNPPTGVPAATYFNAPLGNLPAGSAWGRAAALELAIIDYPNGSFSATAAGNIRITNALILPRTSGSNFINYGSIRGNNPIIGRCTPAAVSYKCEAIIGGFNPGGGRTFIFRLRSRYIGTDYQLEFRTATNGNGLIVNVPDGMATIDVTAKAGDAFRRVIYKVPYNNAAATGLDYVIYSDTDICKNFGIINGSVSPSSIGCPY